VPVIPACEELRRTADAYSAGDPTPPDFLYGGFWDGFAASEEECGLQCVFRALFAGLGIRKPIAMVSVFGEAASLAGLRREIDAVYVGFSGEPTYLDPDWFDLSLVMAPTDETRGILCFPFFALRAHETGLWPALWSPRAPVLAADAPRRRFCVSVVSKSAGEVRNRFAERLSRYRRVDSGGAFRNNIGYFAPRDERAYGDRYFPFLRQYKFTLCFENSAAPTYLTEKLLNAYAAGTVPVYWGADDALAWFNPASYLRLEGEDDAAMDALIARIAALDRDDESYRQMYREPLLAAGRVPEPWTLESLRLGIRRILLRRRPDAFATG